jgi:serine/threonine protein kinase
MIAERRHVDREAVLDMFAELLGVLDYLHTRVPPVLHRDIKPANVIVRNGGAPVLVDFGAVRNVFRSPDETGSTVVGTYGYMPYEQYMGQATPASDLFATAATFLHVLTGRPPRDFMNDDGRIEVPEALPGEPRLRGVIARLLRPSPAERFASAREVRNALVGPSSGMSLSAAPHASLRKIAETVEVVLALPPAPRPLTGATLELMRACTPGALRLMTASEKGEDYWTLGSVASLTFF